jgi:hypothetical protein
MMERSPARLYLNSHLWDFLLCFAASFGLALNTFSCFNMEGTLADSTMITALTVFICCALAFLSGYNRRTLLVTIPIYILAAVLTVAYLNGIDALAPVFSGANSSLLFWPLVIVSSLFVYLCSRTAAGCRVMLAAGGIFMASCRFLLYPVNTPGYVLYMAAAASLLPYRVYYRGVMRAAAGNVSFPRYFVQSFAMTAMAFALALGVFAAVIRPLNLPVADLKLITKLISLEIVDKTGIFSKRQLTNPNLLTDRINDLTELVRQQVNEDMEPREDNRQEEKEQKNTLRNTEAISYNKRSYSWLWILLPALALAAAAPVAAKKLLRRRKYNLIMALPREEAVLRLFVCFTSRMRLAGFSKPELLSWGEFARENSPRLNRAFGDSSPFSDLAGTYQRILYGCIDASEREWETFREFFSGFYVNLRREMGTFRYLLNWFAL